MRRAFAMFPLWRAQISVFPCLISPHVESCFQGAGVWIVLFILFIRFLVFYVVEGKSVWRD